MDFGNKRSRGLGGRAFTLLLEVVVALEAAAEAINGLAGLANPESDGVYRSSQGPHLASLSIGDSLVWTSRPNCKRLNSLGFWGFY